jgi:hypothetical protein
MIMKDGRESAQITGCLGHLMPRVAAKKPEITLKLSDRTKLTSTPAILDRQLRILSKTKPSAQIIFKPSSVR